MTGDRMNVNGAHPVRIPQAGAVRRSMTQESPTLATGGPFASSCGERRQARKTTDRKKNIENHAFNIMQLNSEGVSNKREDLQHFLHEDNIHICCIQETHKEGKTEAFEDPRLQKIFQWRLSR